MVPKSSSGSIHKTTQRNSAMFSANEWTRPQLRNIAHVKVIVANGVLVKEEGTKRISCRLEHQCRENDVESEGLSAFEAHVTEHY